MSTENILTEEVGKKKKGRQANSNRKERNAIFYLNNKDDAKKYELLDTIIEKVNQTFLNKGCEIKHSDVLKAGISNDLIDILFKIKRESLNDDEVFEVACNLYNIENKTNHSPIHFSYHIAQKLNQKEKIKYYMASEQTKKNKNVTKEDSKNVVH